MSNCAWASMNKGMQLYHDKEWGTPTHSDTKMFEHLMMECLQCGLSWDIVYKKRPVLRKCFDNFNYNKIAKYTEKDIKRIMATEGMIRSEQKIRAIINNAQCFVQVRKEFGSFCNYLWGFSNNKTILYMGHATGKIPVSNGLSAQISKDLKKRGFKFVGPVTIYSHLQSCGIINDHDKSCPCYERINLANPTVNKRRLEEVY